MASSGTPAFSPPAKRRLGLAGGVGAGTPLVTPLAPQGKRRRSQGAQLTSAGGGWGTPSSATKSALKSTPPGGGWGGRGGSSSSSSSSLEMGGEDDLFEDSALLPQEGRGKPRKLARVCFSKAVTTFVVSAQGLGDEEDTCSLFSGVGWQ